MNRPYRAGIAGRLAPMLLALVCAVPAHAHDFKAGGVVIDHPYAVPSEAGAPGRVYLRQLHNRGKQDDRLIGARTARAERVELARGEATLDAIDVAAGTRLKLGHRQDAHLRLVGLEKPLADGEQFEMVLVFEHGGESKVRVDVQQPR